MARVGYVGRRAGHHDRRWVRTLCDGGHEVTAFLRDRAGSDDLGVPVQGWNDDGRSLAWVAAGQDLLVAGPLSDAAAAAVEAGVAPTLGISWAFDLLVDAASADVAERLGRTVPHLVGVHVDCESLAVRVRALGAAPEGISVAAWGIDTGFFSPGPTDDARVAGETLVFSARAWEPMYDVPTVVRGFALARQKDPRLRLVLGGDGTERSRISALVKDLDIGDAVTFVGPMTQGQVREWLRRCDVYVSASRSDGSSLSLLEALAVGVPVVVTDLESNREWVTSEVVGSVFPAGDAEALGRALVDEVGTVRTALSRMVRRDLVLGKGDATQNRQVFLEAVERALGSG